MQHTHQLPFRRSSKVKSLAQSTLFSRASGKLSKLWMRCIGYVHIFFYRTMTKDNFVYSHFCAQKRFPSFQPYIQIFNDDGFVYEPYEKDFIYMRWKEHFLVPDHRLRNVNGASFEGFYYICYQRSTNEIKGYYFFRNHPDWYVFESSRVRAAEFDVTE